MWNVVSGNRLLDKRRKQEAQRKHLTALNQIKSMIDNNTPQEYSFLYTRPKAYQKKQGTTPLMQNDWPIFKVKILSWLRG